MRIIIFKSWTTEGLQKTVNTFIANKGVIDIKYAAIVSDAQEQAEYSAMILYR